MDIRYNSLNLSDGLQFTNGNTIGYTYNAAGEKLSVTHQLGRQSQRFIGQFGEVVVNPQTGKIISVNPTSSSKAAKLLKQLGQ